MKKIVSLILTVFFIAAVLVGCSGSKETNAPKQETTKSEQTAKEEPKPVTYKDGTYEGIGEGMHEIKVSVQVSGGKIAKVTITKHEEAADIAKGALEKIPVTIVEKNSPDVDVVSGSTRASEGIIEAVKNALEAAK